MKNNKHLVRLRFNFSRPYHFRLPSSLCVIAHIGNRESTSTVTLSWEERVGVRYYQPGGKYYSFFVGTNSSRISTSRIRAIFLRSFKWGWALLLHIAAMAVVLFPNRSANQTCVLPSITKTSLILLILSAIGVIYGSNVFSILKFL